MVATGRKETLAARLSAVRERTLRLMDRVPEGLWRERVHGFYSPIGWHFGHIGRTEEHWVQVAALGREPFDAGLSFLYEDRPDNPKDNRTTVPMPDACRAYLEETRRRVLASLWDADLDSPDPLVQDGYGWEFALLHECQHQETIVELLCLLARSASPSSPEPARAEDDGGVEAEFVPIPGHRFTMGSSEAAAYDNEREPHEAEVEGFELAATPVTVSEWRRFIGEGGYLRAELWSPEGWAWREAEAAERPFYWLADRGREFGPDGVRTLDGREPVQGVSWFEAEAYARWVGARLPTEVEWEAAWAYAGAEGAFGQDPLHPSPLPPGPGLRAMRGGVWEWCASPFLPYQGFRAFPYDGYSKDHMKGAHRVCRGGSWATSPLIARRTFRNWYVPGYRQGFLGLRLARG